MALLNFKYGAQAGLADEAFSAGTVYVTSDTKKIFVDNPSSTSGRICLGDFQLVSWTKSDTVTSPSTALSNYSLKDSNTLYITVESATGATAMWRYNGTSFVAISNSEEIADIRSDISSLQSSVSGKAPKNHAASDTTYGAASTSKYGHAKLSSAINSESEALAATSKAAKLAYDRGSKGITDAATAKSRADAAYSLAETAKSAAATAQTAANTAQGEVDALEEVVSGLTTTVSGKAPTNHQADDTTYGGATTAKYGHTKLSSATDSDSEALAATPKAVKAAYNLANTAKSNAATANTAASNAQTTANKALPKAGGTMTGFITLHAAPTSNLHAATKKYVDDAKASAISAVTGTADDASSANTVYGSKKYTTEQIAAVNTTINTLKTNIGSLSNIMNFVGTTTTNLTDGATTKPITVGGKDYTQAAGDVVVKGNKEFVWTGSAWEEIGDTSAQATAITNLQNTVGTKPSSPTMDDKLWDEVADLRTDLGEKGAATGTAFARIKTLEEWKSTHSTAFNNLSNQVNTNKGDIADIIAVLTWGSF